MWEEMGPRAQSGGLCLILEERLLFHCLMSPGADAEVKGFPPKASPIICEVEYKVSVEGGEMLVGLKMWRQVGKFEIDTVENGREVVQVIWKNS